MKTEFKKHSDEHSEFPLYQITIKQQNYENLEMPPTKRRPPKTTLEKKREVQNALSYASISRRAKISKFACTKNPQSIE